MIELPVGRVVVTGNEAVALGVILARPRSIASYPITPQTLIVERLSELAVGRDLEFANLESEHSMFGFALAATRAGVRTFTATSSQGLLYSHEQLHRASRERIPLVAVNVNRSVVGPWSLEPDLSDSMSQRDTGWIQLYCSSAQEVLDTVICAYRLAEETMLPALVCAEGFLLSHTSEVVDVPAQEAVDAFLPPPRPPEGWQLDPLHPHAYSGLPQPAAYAAFQEKVAVALEHARERWPGIVAEYAAAVGRPKVGLLDVAGNPDAATALVTIGTIGETARELLAEDDDLLTIRVHAYRPLPAAELVELLARAEHVAVVDRAPAFGAPGPLGEDVRALGVDATDVVCGLGGTDVTPETLRWAIDLARTGTPGPHAVYVPEGV